MCQVYKSEAVTHAENLRRGPAVKLTADAVRQIRMYLKGGRTQKEIAAMFGVDDSTISRIENGKNWRGVE